MNAEIPIEQVFLPHKLRENTGSRLVVELQRFDREQIVWGILLIFALGVLTSNSGLAPVLMVSVIAIALLVALGKTVLLVEPGKVVIQKRVLLAGRSEIEYSSPEVVAVRPAPFSTRFRILYHFASVQLVLRDGKKVSLLSYAGTSEKTCLVSSEIMAERISKVLGVALNR